MEKQKDRKKIIVIVGSARCSMRVIKLAKELGKQLCDNNFRLATGGLGGVMEAVFAGAYQSSKYKEGDTIGVLPVYNPKIANAYTDIVIPSGLGFSRNTILVSMGVAVVAIAGGAGTLSEISLAYQLHKPIVLIRSSGGWTKKISNLLGLSDSLDHRKNSLIKSVSSVNEAVEYLKKITKTVKKYEPCWI